MSAAIKQVKPVNNLDDVYAAVYEDALCRARELVSENSPEFEPLLESLIEQAFVEAV